MSIFPRQSIKIISHSESEIGLLHILGTKRVFKKSKNIEYFGKILDIYLFTNLSI